MTSEHAAAGAGSADPVPYQSLYRRFRPQRFEEVLGQHHVALALRNAVRDGRVGHAYLFSGPRGTGKTSTARILAKALNCDVPAEGEPCGSCRSCLEITRGTSLDVHELDAASNNGVDAMRDLVARAGLATPGRWKVYIVDEVHMLSTAASNALLKTLEEPPGHVVFVLATTDPQKVLPTIRSRTQHFEFRLLGSDVLADLLRRVGKEAGLELPDGVLEAAVRRGRGSARDALSALDQLAAGGELDDEGAVLAELADALAERDAGRALVALAQGAAAGRDAQRLAAELAEYLRQAFLVALAPELVGVAGAERSHVDQIAQRMGLAALVRAIELLGTAQVSMRDAPDPRVLLEVTLVRLAHPETDDSAAAVLERLERLERAIDGGVPGSGMPSSGVHGAGNAGPASVASAAGGGAAPAAGARSPSEAAAAGGEPPRGAAPPTAASGPDLARQTLGAVRRRSREAGRAGAPATAGSGAGSGGSSEPPGGAGATGAAPSSPGAADAAADAADGGTAAGDDADGSHQPASGAPADVGHDARERAAAMASTPSPLPDRDDLVQAWGDHLLAGLPGRARARFRMGRFVAVERGAAVFALPNETHRSYCEEVRGEVEDALHRHFGVRMPLRLVVDDDHDGAGGSRGSTGDGVARIAGWEGQRAADGGVDLVDDPDLLDPAVLAAETEPAGGALSPAEWLKQAFPGAQEV